MERNLCLDLDFAELKTIQYRRTFDTSREDHKQDNCISNTFRIIPIYRLQVQADLALGNAQKIGHASDITLEHSAKKAR